jgi:hypothetical protein
MNKSTDTIKSFSVLKNELNELAVLYGAGVEEFMDLYSECFDSSVDRKWSRLCGVYPELETAHQGDENSILKLLAELHERKEKKGKGPREEKEIVIQTSIIEKDGTLYEQIYNNSEVSFIDCEGNTYDTLEIDGLKHVPIFGDELTEGAVLLPSGLEDYKDEKTLIEEIKTHIHRYIGISPFFETIAAYYILLSWLYDELNTLPYLRVLGDTGTGKSRFLDTVGRLCYKATMVSGAITPAPIYRLIRKWHGTIIIDEGDFRASDEQNEVVKILNCGFERGRPVVRSQRDNPDNLQILPTFSPKILASRKRFKDIALESRCLTEITKETDREDIPYLLPSEFYTEEESLRNKLLLFRFRNHGKVDVEKAQKLKDIDVENRLKQAVSSFIVLFASNKEVYKEFTVFLTAYNRELVEERAETIEGAIINAISEIINERTLRTQSLSNVQNEHNVLFTNEDLEDVYITATDITELLKENYGLHDVTSRGVGRRLKTLGITSKKKGTGKERKRYLDLEERALAKLIKKYIPISVDEMDVKDIKDVYMGEREGKKNNLAACERCEKHALLTTYTLADKKIGVCPDCLKELKEEGERKKKKKEKPTRTVNIDNVKKDGTIRPEAVDPDFQAKQSREARKRLEEEKLLEEDGSLKTLITSYVTNASNIDDRGAMVVALVNRVAKESGYGKDEVKAEIDKMLQGGELLASEDDYGEYVKVAGDCDADDCCCKLQFRPSPNLEDDECSRCGEVKSCEWQIEEDDVWLPICESCKVKLQMEAVE